MGHCTQCIHHYNMFKVAIVVCLAAYAKAEAEADPALLYGAYGYAGYAAPYTYGYAGYPYAYSTLAGYGTTNGANSVGIAGVAPAAAPALAGRYVANSAGVVHVAKREAEADADADAYYGYYGYARPYAYGFGYRSYGYGYPYAYYGKRSADAEPEAKADAALLYGAYGYAGLPYAGYAAYGAYPYAYGAYPYAYGAYYGKRSADAEPEADAYYGYYGYARPYSYGYAPYAYGAYPYGYGYAWGK